MWPHYGIYTHTAGSPFSASDCNILLIFRWHAVFDSEDTQVSHEVQTLGEPAGVSLPWLFWNILHFLERVPTSIQSAQVYNLSRESLEDRFLVRIFWRILGRYVSAVSVTKDSASFGFYITYYRFSKYNWRGSPKYFFYKAKDKLI